jgi:hypothetical protein
MNEIIVCDKCKHEGCTVSEVPKESDKITMSDFAKKCKSPYSMDRYQQSGQGIREWIITCPTCDHSIEYREHFSYPRPYFATEHSP